MTLQEKFIKAYDLATMGVKTKLKDLHGASTVKYVVTQSRKGKYTKEDVLEELSQSLVEIAQEVKEDAQEMYDQINSISE